MANSPSFGTARIFKIQVLSTLAIKCWGKFRVFQFAIAISQQKSCQRLSRSACISCRQRLRHTSELCQELWFGILAIGTTYSTNNILFTYNTHKREKQKTIFIPMITLFSFFGCVCYNRRTHNPMVEKAGAQNITTCENQGKQHELSDH